MEKQTPGHFMDTEDSVCARPFGEDMEGRLYNWKFDSALEYAERDFAAAPDAVKPSEAELAAVRELAEEYGNCGWLDGRISDRIRESMSALYSGRMSPRMPAEDVEGDAAPVFDPAAFTPVVRRLCEPVLSVIAENSFTSSAAETEMRDFFSALPALPGDIVTEVFAYLKPALANRFPFLSVDGVGRELMKPVEVDIAHVISTCDSGLITPEARISLLDALAASTTPATPRRPRA